MVSHALGIVGISCLINSVDVSAAPADRARQLIADVNRVNSIIEVETATPKIRCTNNFARIEAIKKIIAALTPELNQIIGERTNLETQRTQVIVDLGLLRKTLADIDAAIQGIQRQIDDRSKTAAEQLKSVDEKIGAAERDKGEANRILDGKEADYSKFRATNQAKFDAIVDLLLLPNPPKLTSEQQALIDERKRRETEIDVLEETVQKYVSQIAQFQKDRAALINGDTTALSELKKKLADKRAERPAKQKKLEEAKATRLSLNQQIAEKTATINKLSDLRVPEINPICPKIKPNA
jgi:DNA repair exonuclease SbcCD ATPase subunit